MRLRRLGPDDWPTYRAIRLRALASDPDAFGDTLAAAEARPESSWPERLALTDRATVLAEADDGTSIGMAAGGPTDRPDLAGLYGMWVAPEARGQGVGMALVEWVVAWAIETGHPAIGLAFTTTNATAERLYRRAGFVSTGERHPLRDDTDLEVELMERQLSVPPR